MIAALSAITEAGADVGAVLTAIAQACIAVGAAVGAALAAIAEAGIVAGTALAAIAQSGVAGYGLSQGGFYTGRTFLLKGTSRQKRCRLGI